MNIVEIQNKLKDFSLPQLVNEMQNPSGTAPQFLVLTAIQERKRLENESKGKQDPPSDRTVADRVVGEAMSAPGVPTQMGSPFPGGGGIGEIASRMTPNMSDNMPQGASPVRKMQDGGVLGDVEPLNPVAERLRRLQLRQDEMEAARAYLDRRREFEGTWPTSSGGFSQSGAQISANVPEQTDVQRLPEYDSRLVESERSRKEMLEGIGSKFLDDYKEIDAFGNKVSAPVYDAFGKVATLFGWDTGAVNAEDRANTLRNLATLERLGIPPEDVGVDVRMDPDEFKETVRFQATVPDDVLKELGGDGGFSFPEEESPAVDGPFTGVGEADYADWLSDKRPDSELAALLDREREIGAPVPEGKLTPDAPEIYDVTGPPPPPPPPPERSVLDDLDAIEAGEGKASKSDMWLALARAGFSMIGPVGPLAGIGAGGIAGLDALQAAKGLASERQDSLYDRAVARAGLSLDEQKNRIAQQRADTETRIAGIPKPSFTAKERLAELREIVKMRQTKVESYNDETAGVPIEGDEDYEDYNAAVEALNKARARYELESANTLYPPKP